MDPSRWSVDHLTADLRRLGVAGGDLLMVHASLRAVGPVDGGADAVVDSLEAAVGSDGTLFMNMSARDDWAWVNEQPECERPELLRDATPFDLMVYPMRKHGFTDRPVVGIHAVDLVLGFGTLHCLTQQQPAESR